MIEAGISAPPGLPDLTGEHYFHVLGWLYAALKPRTYLEIGTETGGSLCQFPCASIAIDPKFKLATADAAPLAAIVNRPELHLYQTTSDDFFARHDPAAILGGPVEMAFLDGMHLCEFLLRDFINIERYCRPSSIIMLHDCIPVEEAIAGRDQKGTLSTVPSHAGWWAGDVWRTARLLKRARPDLRLTVFDAPPTGLLLITNLNPQDTSLAAAYDEHVAQMMSWSLAGDGLAAFHREMQIVSTAQLSTPEQIAALYRL